MVVATVQIHTQSAANQAARNSCLMEIKVQFIEPYLTNLGLQNPVRIATFSGLDGNEFIPRQAQSRMHPYQHVTAIRYTVK